MSDDLRPEAREVSREIVDRKFTVPLSIGFFGMLSALVGFILAVVEVVLYFKHGAWANFTLFTILQIVIPTGTVNWLVDPQDWIGLQKFLSWLLGVNLVFLLIIGGAIMMYLSELLDRG